VNRPVKVREPPTGLGRALLRAPIRVGRRRVRVDAVSHTAAEGGQVMAD